MAENKNNFSEEELLGQLTKLEQFIQKNTKLVYGVAAAIVIGAAAYFFLENQRAEQEIDAQKELFVAQYLYAQDSTDVVLNGDGNSVIGVEEVAEEYPSTDAGNLANFYTGVVYLKKGEFETSIEYLEKFSASDYLVQSRAYSLIGDAYMELEEYADAASYYEKAADRYPNEQFSPKYLTKLALAYQKGENDEEALETYNEILSLYPNSAEANTAKKYSALLETRI